MLTGYDVRNRPTLITYPLGGTIQLGYDANNNVLTHRDQRNNLTEFTYDTMNRLKTRKDALLRTKTFDYDIAGRLKQITDRKSQVSGFGYDDHLHLRGPPACSSSASPTRCRIVISYLGWGAGDGGANFSGALSFRSEGMTATGQATVFSNGNGAFVGGEPSTAETGASSCLAL